jgi:hypothetical protein
MILLQAEMAAGIFLFFIGLPVFLLLVTPILLGILMRFAWRRRGKQEYIKNKMPYYKDPLLFFPLLILSMIIACIFFYLLLILFDKLFPEAGAIT